MPDNQLWIEMVGKQGVKSPQLIRNLICPPTLLNPPPIKIKDKKVNKPSQGHT